jgi:hypothetical protein
MPVTAWIVITGIVVGFFLWVNRKHIFPKD